MRADDGKGYALERIKLAGLDAMALRPSLKRPEIGTKSAFDLSVRYLKANQVMLQAKYDCQSILDRSNIVI